MRKGQKAARFAEMDRAFVLLDGGVRQRNGWNLATARLLRISRMVTTDERMRAAAGQLGIRTSP